MNANDDLELNAFVDGELSPDQQAEILEAFRQDPDLARRAFELGQLKARMRLAYAQPPLAKKRACATVRSSWHVAVASLILLAVGVATGWSLHPGTPLADNAQASRIVLLDPQGRGQTPADAKNHETRIVFHFTSGDQHIAGELLDDVETMLKAYKADHRPLRVEIVSNSDGLALLREHLSQHKVRIHQMAMEFPNLTFVACKNTIERLKVENGIEVKLLPDAHLIESGVHHVVMRQKEGWSYIRV